MENCWIDYLLPQLYWVSTIKQLLMQNWSNGGLRTQQIQQFTWERKL
jgi:hypothetical protein